MNYEGQKFDFECDPEPSNVVDFDYKNKKYSFLEQFNADKKKYEGRFWENYSPNDTFNIPGYGKKNPYIPPLESPQSVLTVYDRYMLTAKLGSKPLDEGFWDWVRGFPNGDTADSYMYSDAQAAGSQLYPEGLSKYYDLFSVTGLLKYFFYLIWVDIQQLILPFTLFVPIDVWIALYDGLSI